MKKLLLVLLTFISLNAVAQIKVKEGSFHQIEGFVMLDKNEHLDMNNAPMALIKISTENIKAEERRRITFKGNLATYFDVHFEPTEIYLYITARAATFIEIHHPDYGKTEYWFPQDLKDFCAYEMVLQNEAVQIIQNVQEQEYGSLYVRSFPTKADVYVDDKLYGQTPNIIHYLTPGEHELKLVKKGRVTLTKPINILNHETIQMKEKLQLNTIEFAAINVAYSVHPQTTVGVTVGSVKRFGWFATVMSDFSFRFGGERSTTENVMLTGRSSSARLSLMGGLMLKVAGPVCVRAGAGYGMRTKSWKGDNGKWYVSQTGTYKGLDLTAGLQLNLKDYSVSVDAVTTKFETLEIKVGFGLNRINN